MNFINTIKLLTKLLVRVLICMIIVNSIANTNDKANFDKQLQQCKEIYGKECGIWEIYFKKMHKILINKSTLEINKNDESTSFIALKEACEKWYFTPKMLKEFFLISETYADSGIPYHIFDYHLCTIDGSFVIDNERYMFEINLGGSFEINDKNGKKFYFGCDYRSKPKCAEYLQ